MTRKATTRPAAGTRHNQSTTHHKQLIAAIVPRPELAADYVAMTALLHHPEVAAPFVSRLHPSDWTTDLHRIMARIALAHLRTIGRVDRRQLSGVLHDAETVRPNTFALELRTLACVAGLICGDVVTDAVAVVTADRREAAA